MADGYAKTQRVQRLSDDEFQNIVKARIDAAISHRDELSTDREKATKYARGDISDDLQSIEGRSSVVSMDLRDTVMEIMPSLMRIFVAQGNAISYEPTGQEDEQGAAQASDYANYLFMKKCDGFMVMYMAFQDALIRRSGPIKTWWDQSKSVTAQRYAGIDPETFVLIQQQAAEEPGAMILDPEADEQGKVSFVLRRVKENAGMRVVAMPPEELIYSADATNLKRPLFIGQYCTNKTVGDLVALGYDYDLVLEHASHESGVFEAEDEARRFSSGVEDDTGGDPTAKPVEYVEGYTLIDADGDGIPEMHKVCCIGSEREIVKTEMVSDHPFSNLVPFPEPHTPEGWGFWDLLKDLMLIRSQLLRLGLDGLSSVITPRQKFRRNGRVNLDQLQDARPGGLVGCDDPTSDIVPMDTDKAAPALAMQAYQQMGEVKTARTGQAPGSAGLTPDVLQSTTRIQANDVVQRAQAQVELIARMFGEGLRDVFTKLLKGITHYQDKEEIIRLRGRWVTMDPRTWNPDMDAVSNVGLGTGNVEERVASAQMGLQIVEAIMTKAGPQNPWTTVEKVRKALFNVYESMGKPPEEYLMTAEEWQQQVQMQQQMQQGQPPQEQKNPLVEAETIKAQAKLQSDREKMKVDADTARDKMILDAMQEVLKAGATPDQAIAWGETLSQVIGAPRVDAGTQIAGVQ